MSDIIFGAIFIGLALAVYFYSQTFPKPLGQPGPGLFPKIVSLLMLSASTFLVLTSIVKRPFRQLNWRKVFQDVFSPGARNFLSVVIMVLAYLFISPHVGFFLSAVLVLFMLMLQLKVHPLVAFGVAITVAAISRFLFQDFLKIPLPPGPFPGGW